MATIRGKCRKRGVKQGSNSTIQCYQEEVEELNHEIFDAGGKRRDDVRNPRPSNAYQGHEEELLVFLDSSMSMRGTRLSRAKIMLEHIFPRFERTPTSVHLIGGTQRSMQSSIFQERVESNGGEYTHTYIRATLIWDNCNDLDLHILEPGGTEIYYSHKQSTQSHGYLDIDQNVGWACSERPVENIRWKIGESSPIPGRYEVWVHFFSHDNRAPTHTPFQLELSVGAETKHFRLFVSEPNQRKPVHSFEYEGQQLSKESKELFSPSMDFTLDDVFNFWTCESWTTYMWKYILDSLLSASASKAFRTWDVIIVTDGEDNDSPEPFSGPSGFNAMMNSLHASGIRPRISVYCIGSEHCTGDANGMHFYRDLVLASGGVFVADLAGPNDFSPINTFAVQVTGSVEERQLTEQNSKQEWLLLKQSGAPIANRNEPYTQELVQKQPGEIRSSHSSARKRTDPDMKCSQQGDIQVCH